MKKLSKRTTRGDETIGIDLGDNVSAIASSIKTAKRWRKEPSATKSSIEKHFGDRPRRAALEAGAQSAWISRELHRLGHEVIVANPRELKWITSSDTKNDPVDARSWLCWRRWNIAVANSRSRFVLTVAASNTDGSYGKELLLNVRVVQEAKRPCVDL